MTKRNNIHLGQVLTFLGSFTSFLKQGWSAKLKTSIIKWSFRWQLTIRIYLPLGFGYREALLGQIKSNVIFFWIFICIFNLWMFSKDGRCSTFFFISLYVFRFFWDFHNVL